MIDHPYCELVLIHFISDSKDAKYIRAGFSKSHKNYFMVYSTQHCEGWGLVDKDSLVDKACAAVGRNNSIELSQNETSIGELSMISDMFKESAEISAYQAWRLITSCCSQKLNPYLDNYWFRCYPDGQTYIKFIKDEDARNKPFFEAVILPSGDSKVAEKLVGCKGMVPHLNDTILLPPARTPLAAIECIKDIIENKVVHKLNSRFGDSIIEMEKYAKRVFGQSIKDIAATELARELRGLEIINCLENEYFMPPADVFFIDIARYKNSNIRPFLSALTSCIIPLGKSVIVLNSHEPKLVPVIHEFCSQGNGEIRNYHFNEGIFPGQSGTGTIGIVRL